MARRFVIYGLFDPSTEELRYIGQSIRGLERARNHWRPSALKKRENPHTANWIRGLQARGLVPEIDVLEEFASAEALDEAEIFWIQYYRGIGCRLTNLTDGGNKPPVKIWSAEERAAKSAAMKGHPGYWAGKNFSDEHRARIGDSCQGTLKRKRTEEERLAMSRRQGGRAIKDQNGNLYLTIADASRRTGAHRFAIREVLRGNHSSAKGYVFTYAA